MYNAFPLEDWYRQFEKVTYTQGALVFQLPELTAVSPDHQWLKLEGTSGSLPLLKQDHLRAGCSGLYPDGFWMSLSMETAASLGNLCQYQVSHTTKKFSWQSWGIFCVCAYCICLCHWAPLQRLVPSLWTLPTLIGSLQGFSRLTVLPVRAAPERC